MKVEMVIMFIVLIAGIWFTMPYGVGSLFMWIFITWPGLGLLLLGEDWFYHLFGLILVAGSGYFIFTDIKEQKVKFNKR